VAASLLLLKSVLLKLVLAIVVLCPLAAEAMAGLRTLTGHANSVLSVAISPDGRMLASGSATTPSSSGTVERNEASK
jgi:WD40 repeat protein